jgi:hypothetical protein
MGMPGSMRQAVAMVGGCEPGGCVLSSAAIGSGAFANGAMDSGCIPMNRGFSLKPQGPGGPGRSNIAPPGLVMWVNRESFTKPKLWYGSPARAEWLWMLKLFKFAASTFSLQARRADTSPAGGDSHRWV